jgi:pyruvate dehydrogenase E2 component (dihydrolipoamide acetyltransferase)
MPTQIKLPSLGENIDSAGVLSILVKEGDVVAKDQDLLEIETDKATMPIPSPQAGKIAKVLVGEGDTISIGQAIFEIEADGKEKKTKAKDEKPASAKAAPKKKEETADDDVQEAEEIEEEVAEQQEEPEEKPKPKKDAGDASKKSKTPPPPPPEEPPVIVEPDPDADKDKGADKPSGGKAAAGEAASAAGRAKKKPATKSSPPSDDVPGNGHASAAAGPAVRRLARELGVELRRVRPSGEGGRITEEDVRSHVRRSQVEAEAKVIKGVTPPGKADSDSFGGIRREKMSRLRQTIARNMLASYTSIPQLTNFDDVDLTELEHLRAESQDDYSTRGVKLTTMPFLIKACAVALKHHPVVNASVGEEGDEIVYKEYVNIGIAVDTERGLVVPVLRDADRKNIPQIAAALAELAERSRGGSLTLEDFQGGTFTISNLGSIGGTYSTPIINPPQVAILLAGRSRMLPQWIEEEWLPRLMLPLSITYDHRVVDGAAAARFLNDVKGYLANPGRLLLAP